jgi:hypothetical protein
VEDTSKLRTGANAYWFPAKKYGWGWGTPATWQGWAVIGGYMLLLLGGIALIDTRLHVTVFLAYTAVVSALFVAICWLKGEPPRWRWGNNG